MKLNNSPLALLSLLMVVLFSHCNAQTTQTDALGPELESLKDSYTMNIFEDSKGTMWFGTVNDGLVKYENDEFTYLEQQQGLAGKNVRDITEDSKGELWIATENGISVYDGDSFKTYDENSGLRSNDVNCITIASDGIIWIGTAEGISRFVDGKFFQFQLPASRKPEASDSKIVYAITEGANGVMWFGTDNGVWKFNKNALQSEKPFTNLTVENGLTDNTILDVLEDSKGNLWLATKNGGVCQMKSDTISKVSEEPKDDREQTGWSLFESKNGTVYFPVNGQNVYQYSENKVTDFIPAANCYGHTITCVYQSSDGTFWLGGWTGIFRVKN